MGIGLDRPLRGVLLVRFFYGLYLLSLFWVRDCCSQSTITCLHLYCSGSVSFCGFTGPSPAMIFPKLSLSMT